MPCASPRPAAPNVECRRANALRRNVFRAAAARTTLRKTPTFVACHRVHAKKRPISFPKRTMLTFPEQKRRTKHHAQANAAEKHAGPHGSGNGRAGRTAELPLHVLHGFQGRRRSWDARQMGNLRRRPEATTAHGADARQRRPRQQALGRSTARGAEAFHPSIPKNRHGRARAGRTPGFSEAHDAPALRLSAGAGRNGGAALALRAFLCHAAAAQKRGAKRRRTAARPGTDAPGRSRENLSTKIPA